MTEDSFSRKRARQEVNEDSEPTKKLIVESDTGPEAVKISKDQIEYKKMIKSLKKKKQEQRQSIEQQTDQRQKEGDEDIEEPKKQKRHKQKKRQKQYEDEKDGKPREKSKKKKKDKHKQKEKQDEDIKEETGQSQNQDQKHKDKKEKKFKKVKEEPVQESGQQKAKKKKKKSEDKKKDKDRQQKENQQDNTQKIQSKNKNKNQKSKTIKNKQQKRQAHSDEDQQSQVSSESQKKKTKKIKKQKQEKPPEKKRRGRKPAGPIKRKKQSIFQRQQIINKKYRVKKRSHYLNKASDRAWGPMRAGPYREVKKASKEDIQKMREHLYGQKSEKSQKNQEVSQVQGGQDNKDNDQVIKIEQIASQEQSAEQKIQQEKPNKKGKKKNGQSDEEKSNSKPKKKSKKKKVQEDEQDRVIAKADSKKNKKKIDDNDDDVKLQSTTQTTRATKRSKKSSKSQKGDDQAKLEENEDSRSRRRSTKREDSSEQQQDYSDSGNNGKTKSRKAKKDDSKKQGSSKRKPRTKATRQQESDFTKQQSQKIITLFSADGGNYPEMMKQLPGIRLKKVRLHLRMLFHRALDTITYHVTKAMQRKIKEWEQDEKVEIVRQLHRIRSSNRLLSENNVQFREDMTTLMRSYNDVSLVATISDNRMQALYRKLQAFVRGYNTINRSKRIAATSITESKNKQKQQRYKFSKEVTRKPIISGGHLLSKSIKSEFKEQPDVQVKQQRNKIVQPDKVMLQWTREEEMFLCQQYIGNPDADQHICDLLKEKYGPSVKWRDFELIGRKIDQLLKYSLIKLQNLTARPYSQSQRKSQQDRKRAKLQQKLRRQNPDAESLTDYYHNKRKNTSMFIYDNEIFQKQQRLEYKHRIFKNLSLLERQIFGHLQSYKLKTALVRILIEEFPPEEAVEDAVRRAKDFSKWARDEEKKTNISSIKNIFAGEREQRDQDGHNDTDYMNEDSIMADIDKVDIIKRNYDIKQTMRSRQYEFSDEDDKEQSKSRQGSLKFSNRCIGQQANQAILIDSEQEVYDFQQPPSKQQQQSCKQQQIDVDQQQPYTMLQKLYTELSNKPPKGT